MKHYFKVISAVLLFIAFTAVSWTAPIKKKIYKIGDRGPAGGWIFYDRGIDVKPGDLVRWRYLEAAPEDQSAEASWCEGNMRVTGANGIAIGAGSTNSAKILKMYGENARAAKICADYNGGGKRDWYLPSKKELELLYTNLKKKGIGNFADKEYWSSTESDESYAWYQGFKDGAIDNNTKTNLLNVRAIRAFRVE